MLLFVCCSNCKEAIEARDILDVCQYLSWECPKCSAWNAPLGDDCGEEIIIEINDGEIVGGVDITELAQITEGDASAEDMAGNILEKETKTL